MRTRNASGANIEPGFSPIEFGLKSADVFCDAIIFENESRWSRVFCRLPSSSFSEMSPACFRPAFDVIGEIWFDGCAQKREIRYAGSPRALVCVQTPAPFYFQLPGWLRRFLILRPGQHVALNHPAFCRNSSGHAAFSWNLARK